MFVLTFAKYILTDPCWSLFQHFYHVVNNEINNNDDTTLNKYLYVPSSKLDSYTTQLINIFKEHLNVTILENIENLNNLLSSRDSNDYHTTWLAEQTQPSDCSVQSVINQTLPLIACKWFMKQEDISSLQKCVLGKNYQYGCGSATNTKLRILVLDREGDNREWIHSRTFYNHIKLLYQSSFDIKYIPTFKHFSLYKQALAMHTSDIIITTHGAQLTNVAYIKKCTAVIELFPRNYYLYFYQLLTLVAGGIHFEGYLFGSNRLKDTRENIDTLNKRVESRSNPILTSPESLILKIPIITSAILECRSKCL